MKYTACSYLLFLFWTSSFSQYQIKSNIKFEGDNEFNSSVKIYNKARGFVNEVNQGETFFLQSNIPIETYIFIAQGYDILEKKVDFTQENTLNLVLSRQLEKLNEVVLSAKKKQIFALKRMQDYEKTTIYAGKKTEVILVEQSMANLAANNARQIFNQVPGLNIYQSDDAGLQLHIGGRGLDPNRTSNFNTRQNGYDISADVLGYPESYYTPPAEAIEEIQIIRGAASLQYGTQFGGLVNFKLKDAITYRSITGVIRNTLGSNGLYTNYTQVSGRFGKWRYISFLNIKKGDGFRPNSGFDSKNLFTKITHDFNDNTKVSAEVTYLDYLAQQAGGLTDNLFKENPYQSNRERNWFGLNWFLYNIKFEHTFSKKSNMSVNVFGLDAERKAIGFRSNRVDQIDSNEERDLIKGDFNNYGIEIRWLQNYSLGNKKAVFLVGGKYYKAKNTSAQGPGSAASDADFSFYKNRFPNYNQQSYYTYPNKNLALFVENIFYLSEKLSFTPGMRYENILTSSDGSFKKINTDAAGNVILNETISANKSRKRSFVLFGLGASYKVNKSLEFYANFSQNYRSVTFTDISIINPAFSINPNITDEKGNTFDLGIRGKIKKILSFDLNLFNISYRNRIGFVQKVDRFNSVKSERGNVGNARLYGIESLIDINFVSWLKMDSTKYALSSFLNYSYINSEYISTEKFGIEGNKVEFVPTDNLKAGLMFGYKNLALNFQYSHVSQQFTDASNAVEGSISGVIGQIPTYNLLDFSMSYTLNKFKFEFGINNILNEAYFTRRANGYPGPGIIPSPNQNIYLSTQYKF
ncbi:MAG: TonB-dependent receptor [Flavobacteriaceae bacterium]|nr:TonB-dependent receptor [Flavobacteriaceae bacterium]